MTRRQSVLSDLDKKFRESGEDLLPSDVIFAREFAPSTIDFRKWWPIPRETRLTIRLILDRIKDDETRTVVEMAYGLYDGEYRSFEEISRELKISHLSVVCHLHRFSKLCNEADKEVFATLTDEAREALEQI